jgi:hypothetical protein
MVKFLYNFIKLITLIYFEVAKIFIFLYIFSSSSDIKFPVGTFILFRSGTLKEHVLSISCLCCLILQDNSLGVWSVV